MNIPLIFYMNYLFVIDSYSLFSCYFFICYKTSPFYMCVKITILQKNKGRLRERGQNKYKYMCPILVIIIYQCNMSKSKTGVTNTRILFTITLYHYTCYLHTPCIYSNNKAYALRGHTVE